MTTILSSRLHGVFHAGDHGVDNLRSQHSTAECLQHAACGRPLPPPRVTTPSPPLQPHSEQIRGVGTTVFPAVGFEEARYELPMRLSEIERFAYFDLRKSFEQCATRGRYQKILWQVAFPEQTWPLVRW